MQDFFKRLLGTKPTTTPSPAVNPQQQEINTLLETAATALEQGYHATALETYERGLVLARQRGDRISEGYFLNGVGAAYVAQENFEDALPVLDQALELARELKDQRSLARALNNLGSFYAKQENWGNAQTYHQQALDTARPTGNAEIITLALENLAQDYMKQDNPRYAQHLLKEAVVITQAGQRTQSAARVIGELAEATLAMGERVSGQKLMVQAVNLAQQQGQIDQQLRWLQQLAKLEMENRSYAKAIEYLQTAENLALRLGNQTPEFFMESALDLSTAYQMNGNSTQAEEYATRALAQARSTNNAEDEAVALMRLGLAANTNGDYERAATFLLDALALFENGTLSNPDEQLQILVTLSSILTRQKKGSEAQQMADRALRLAKSGADVLRQAEALHLLGNLAFEQGEREPALGYWQQALNLMLETNNHAQAAQLYCDIARARKEGGDYRASLVEYEKALMLLNNIKHPPTRGLVLSNAATVYTEMGDIDTAQAFYDESIQIARQSGDQRAESLRLGNLGWFYALTGRPQSAIHQLEGALKISRELDDTLMIAVQSNNLARTYYLLKDYETARGLHKQAIAAATAINAERWRALFQSDYGETLVAVARTEEADPLYRSALEISERVGDLENEVRTQTRLAALLLRTGRRDEALQLAAASEQRSRKMRYQRGIAAALAVLGDAAREAGNATLAQERYNEAYRLFTILHDPGVEGLKPYMAESA